MFALWLVTAGGGFLCSDIFKWCHSAAGVLHVDGTGILIEREIDTLGGDKLASIWAQCSAI